MGDQEVALLFQCLHLLKSSVTPGKGKEKALLIRRVCDTLGVDEDLFLEGYVLKNKARWGLTPNER